MLWRWAFSPLDPLRVGAGELFADFLGSEHPVDVGLGGVSLVFPGGDLGDDFLLVVDASVQALTAQDADLDLDHVQPAGALGGMMEVQALEHAAGFRCGEGVVQGAGRMGRQIVEHYADQRRLRIVEVDQLTHADGKVPVGAPVGDLDPAPGPMGVEEDEQVDCAVAVILAIVTLELARAGRDRLTDLANQLGRALVEAHHRPLGAGISA